MFITFAVNIGFIVIFASSLKNAQMKTLKKSLPTAPEHESYRAGSLVLPDDNPTGKVFLLWKIG